MREHFTLSKDETTFVGNILINNKKTKIIIVLNKDFSHEKIAWLYIEKVLKYIDLNYLEIIQKANLFAKYLMENSGIYKNEDLSRVKGVTLEYIEILGFYLPSCESYALFFDFDSDYHIDTYGRIVVKYLNDSVIGVERLQW